MVGWGLEGKGIIVLGKVLEWVWMFLDKLERCKDERIIRWRRERERKKSKEEWMKEKKVV